MSRKEFIFEIQAFRSSRGEISFSICTKYLCLHRSWGWLRRRNAV